MRLGLNSHHSSVAWSWKDWEVRGLSAIVKMCYLDTEQASRSDSAAYLTAKDKLASVLRVPWYNAGEQIDKV